MGDTKNGSNQAKEMMLKLSSRVFPWLILLTCILLYLYTSVLSLCTTTKSSFMRFHDISKSPACNFFEGRWIRDPSYQPIYEGNCPFHRNAWNCLRNKRDNMRNINSWRWVPNNCSLQRVRPLDFLGLLRDKNIGFVGDSLNENFLVSFLCILHSADDGARKWKRKGAWRGGYFPKFNVTVAYHRAVLLANYDWQPAKFPGQDGVKGIYRVDVDVPANDWVNITKFYDVLVFNSGHWWGDDKFPKETPLVFYEKGKPLIPPLKISDGLQVVLKNMVSFIEREVPPRTIKFWRTQSPRHFYGGEWNENGSCLFDEPLDESQLDMWFDPKNKGVNKEAREVNRLIRQALEGTSIKLLDLTHLSEFRADAHPAVWLGKQDAVAIWGQDCMHWCLPGLPDVWVDILSELILNNLGRG
ncbi:protein trichome birefringence-like 12 isoform X2 [Aristolochia californica]|uniref:protein trichome birefringence-like 12 isoform X2 n=1 Tax=Aristolochia californica TaxID=171875 RepID=UPI0035DFA7DA